VRSNELGVYTCMMTATEPACADAGDGVAP
jgi:hypothetical protein